MTIFITDSFKLDLSHLNVRFSEKNTFFANSLIKQHSFPFKIPRDRNFINFFNFVASDNSIDANQVLTGKLFRNDRWHDAELLITDISKNIETIIYYKLDKLQILNEPLKSLPWPMLNVGNDIFAFAEDAITKNYPQTIVNFSEVHYPDKHKESAWGAYDGFLNNHKNTAFQHTLTTFTNYTAKSTAMNEMVPFMYIREIMRFIFEQINYSVIGEFTTNTYINKALWYHSNSIYHTNEAYANTIPAIMPLVQANVIPSYVNTHNLYRTQLPMLEAGAYRIKIKIDGEFLFTNPETYILKLKFNGALMYQYDIIGNGATDIKKFGVEKEIIFEVPEALAGASLDVETTCTLYTYNSLKGNIAITGTTQPIYNEEIPLSSLLPDITIGEFVEKVKETFKLTSVINTANQTIALDFFKNQNHENVINLAKFSQIDLPRKMNKSIGYSVKFANQEVLNLDKSGDFIETVDGYTHIKLPIEPLAVKYINAVPSVQHQDNTSLLFFESNANAHPFVTDGEVIFTRIGFVHYFLRQWLYQMLNSETVNTTLHLPIYLASKITAQSELWLNNNYFLIESVNRENINKLFEKLTVKLFKLKSLPKFNLVIDGSEGPGGETFLPPIINIGYLNALDVFVPKTEYDAVYHPGGMFGNPSPSISVRLNASFSVDPQGLDLSFGWELISSPYSDLLGEIIPQDSTNSIVTFKRYSTVAPNGDIYGLTGVFELKLTVYNTQGLFATKIITITHN